MLDENKVGRTLQVMVLQSLNNCYNHENKIAYNIFITYICCLGHRLTLLEMVKDFYFYTSFPPQFTCQRKFGNTLD